MAPVPTTAEAEKWIRRMSGMIRQKAMVGGRCRRGFPAQRLSAPRVGVGQRRAEMRAATDPIIRCDAAKHGNVRHRGTAKLVEDMTAKCGFSFPVAQSALSTAPLY
jgi:hypothetical protein